jgi:hypothetical protein
MRLNVNGLFNDAVSSKDCIELNDTMIMHSELERMWKKVVMV